MKNIYLVRHCQAVGQDAEAALTDQGREDAARKIVDFFVHKNIGAIVSSPFKRAVETIKPFAEIARIDIELDERLKERILSSENLEDWLTKLEQTYQDMSLRFAGGESSRKAMNRGIAVIEELASRSATNIIVVTHGALLSLILKHYNEAIGFNDWKNLSTPDIYHLEISQGRAKIKRMWRE